MSAHWRRPTTVGCLVAAMLFTLALASARAGQQSGHVEGRRLDDALHALQVQGLRLIFTSELVTRALRVVAEPRSSEPRERLAELLAPHGLVAVDGPGGTVLVVRRPVPAPKRVPSAREPAGATAPPSPPDTEVFAAPAYQERVVVVGNAASENGSHGWNRRLDAGALLAFGSFVADDPVRAVQTLPGVAAGDDFRSEVSVRASPYRHASIVVDGVAAPWLRHAAFGRGDAGSLTMLGRDAVEGLSVQVGAYDRRDGSQLGPQLNVTIREGSRTDARTRLAVSGASSAALLEGPLGSSSRGSWLIGLRKSHVEWPVGRSDHGRSVFGFADVQSKFAYDLRPGQHLSLTAVLGLSQLERDDPGTAGVADGVNRAGLIAAAWRSVIGPNLVVKQQVSLLTHAILNRDASARPFSRGSNSAASYRGDLMREVGGGVLETGLQVRRVRGSRAWLVSQASAPLLAPSTGILEDGWLERSGYGTWRWSAAPGLTIAPGVRVQASSHVESVAVDRWIRAEWAPRPRWRLHGSAGIVHQAPGFDEAARSAVRLHPERAWQFDVGAAHRLTESTRWEATAYVRRERDLLRVPGVTPGAVDFEPFRATDGRAVQNALSGTAQGLELLVERRTQEGLSGWIGYTYGVARHRDGMTGEAFPADFDQRHGLNLAGSLGLFAGTRFGTTLRVGSGMPTASRLLLHNSRLLVGDARNALRLPTYARLDLRGERTFGSLERRATLFAEIANVLNRTNYGLAGPRLLETGEIAAITEPLFPRLFTAGVRVVF